MRYTATLYGLAVPGALAIAGCGVAVTHSAQPAAAAAPPSTTAQSAASSNLQATAPSAPAANTCNTQVSTWVQNGAASQDQTVVNDIDALRTAISNANSAMDPGIVSAATTLSGDAKSAAKNSPPKCSGLHYKYLVAMAALAFGGIAVEYGHDTNGTALLTKGINKLTPVLTRINSMAGV